MKLSKMVHFILKCFFSLTYLTKTMWAYWLSPRYTCRVNTLKINEPRYIALHVVSGSIKKLFSIDCVCHMIVSILTFLNQKLIIFPQYCFNRFKSVTPHCLYRAILVGHIIMLSWEMPSKNIFLLILL